MRETKTFRFLHKDITRRSPRPERKTYNLRSNFETSLLFFVLLQSLYEFYILKKLCLPKKI